MRENESDSGSSGGCPVAKDANVNNNGSSKPHSWSSWLGFGGGATTVKKEGPLKTSAGGRDSIGACPMDNKPASLEEAAAYSQDPHPDQKGVVLSTHRMISSIPRGATEEKGPHHQPTTSIKSGHSNDDDNTSNTPSHWIYPSEQQFFHALRKKGWDNVEASSIPSVLEIHNTVNERTWKQVQEWEADMDRDIRSSDGSYVETDLKLVRFMGRPNDLSPQAFVWTKLLRWSEPPFDRHDWYVQKQPRRNHDATHKVLPEFPIQRYVIDYYMIPPVHPDMPPTPFVDSRPALDSPRAWYQRACRMLQEELPALTSEYYAWRARQPRYYDGSLPSTTTTTTNNNNKKTTNQQATQKNS